MDASIVIPLHNEEDSVVPLLAHPEDACSGLAEYAEVIYPDDGRSDEPIGQRSALSPGVLMIAVGVQRLALGLLGELVAFCKARESEPKRIRQSMASTDSARSSQQPMATRGRTSE